jgi:hypothetical protein
MSKLHYLLIGLFLFQLSGFSQNQNFNNGTLEHVNAIYNNDKSITEKIIIK